MKIAMESPRFSTPMRLALLPTITATSGTNKDKFLIDKDGYVLAPTEPGLGYPIDRDALDKIMKRIDR